jgi:hypothetical protein
LNGGDLVIAYDNIFAVAPGAYGVRCVAYGGGAGSLVERHNCWCTTDGSPLTFVKNDANITEPPVMAAESVEADPDFVNAAGHNLRPRNPKVLRGGRADVEGSANQIGAVVQAYEFARRARMANAGRTGVVK